jgi:N-acetylglucosamine kinase-like BadF-type ATPase
MSTHYLLGVDGGTTKTIALVADDRGRIVGAGRAGGSNWTGGDVTAPMRVVAEAAHRALESAGLAGDDVSLGVFCLAGADWPEDHTRRAEALAGAGLAQRLAVKNDAFAGLRAGSARPYGVVIAAGTGTNTAAIAPDGREWAFGYYVTYGGAGDVAGDAIAALLRAEDGRDPPTALTDLVLSRLAQPSVEALLRALTAGQISASARLSLCPLVFDAATRADPAAVAIVERQAGALAEYAIALIRRFDMHAIPFDVVLSGSLFKGAGPLLTDAITHAVHRVAPHARIVRARFEPAVGALLLAFDALGLATGEDVMAALAATDPGPAFYSTADGVGYTDPRRVTKG